jgi:H+/gluconate symporter-like permease
MMADTITRATLSSTVVAMAMLLGFDFLSASQFIPSPSANANFNAVLQWLRVVGGVIGFFGAVWGIWIYARYIKNKKTAEGAATALAIYKEELAAQKVQSERLQRELTQVREIAVSKDAEVTMLRSKTDVTELIKRQDQLMEMKRTHDTQMVEMIVALQKTGQDQFNHAMSALSEFVKMLGESSTGALKVGQDNHGLLVKVLETAQQISRRLGVVEIAVKDVARNTDTDIPEAPNPPTERRKRERP